MDNGILPENQQWFMDHHFVTRHQLWCIENKINIKSYVVSLSQDLADLRLLYWINDAVIVNVKGSGISWV